MENNLHLTGDEARVLLSLLIQTPIFQLYQKLNEISLVQPPKEK